MNCQGCGKPMKTNGGLSQFWHDACVEKADARMIAKDKELQARKKEQETE